MSRAANALKTNAMAVGSTLMYVAPHMAGAIDVVVVQQPDGTFKSSPFYVRFGKYTGMRTQEKRVKISVNGQEADFHMHLGTTGEAYFVVEHDQCNAAGDSGEEGEDGGTADALPEQASIMDAEQAAAEGRANAEEQMSSLPGPSPSAPLPDSGEADGMVLPPAAGEHHATVDPAPSAPAAFFHMSSSPAVSGNGNSSKGIQGPAQGVSPDSVSADEPPSDAVKSLPRSSLTAGLTSTAENKIDSSIPSAASASAQTSAHDSTDSPAHPWSVANPRFLASAGNPQSNAPTVSPQAAAAPVGAPLAGPDSTAIPPSDPEPAQQAVQEGLGARMQLEAVDAKVRQGQAAPAAVADANRNLTSGHAGSDVPADFQEIAVANDRHAAATSASMGSPAASAHATDSSILAPQPAPVPPASTQQRVLPAEDTRPSSPRLSLSTSSGLSSDDEAELQAHTWLAQPDPARVLANGTSYSPFSMAEVQHREDALDRQEGPHDCARSPPHAQQGLSEASLEALVNGSVEPRNSSFAYRSAAMPISSSRRTSMDRGNIATAQLDELQLRGTSCPSVTDDFLDSVEGSGQVLGSSAPAMTSGAGFGMQWQENPPARGHSWDGASAASHPAADESQRVPTLSRPAVQLSMCGSVLQEGMSPSEAWDAFMKARISQAAWQQEASTFMTSPDLMCGIGNRAYPWRQACPHLIGGLAFGNSWQEAGDCLGNGVVMASSPWREHSAPPNSGSKDIHARRSGWRGWLPSWGASSKSQRGKRKSSEGHRAGLRAMSRDVGAAADAAVAAVDADLLAGDAATAEPIDAALRAEEGQLGVKPQLTPAAAAEAAVVASMRQPGKRRAFVPHTEQLSRLPLQAGQNTIDFCFGRQRLSAYLYFLQWDARLVITDVDGTITRTDVLGHILPRVGLDWSHAGITRLFSHIRANGYDVLFLSSRAIAQASATREYLHNLSQNGHTLPSGPVIISPDGLFPSLYRELVLRRPHEFKIRALADIRALFPGDFSPFYAGFGNRDTDEISYLSVGVPASRIVIINSKGELRKASSAVATSTWSSLGSIAHLVDMMFPPILRIARAPKQQHSDAVSRDGSLPHSPKPGLTVGPPREEFTDLQFWRVTPALIADLPEDEGRVDDNPVRSAPEATAQADLHKSASPQRQSTGANSSLAKPRSGTNLAWLGLGSIARGRGKETDSEEETDEYESGIDEEVLEFHSPFSSFTAPREV